MVVAILVVLTPGIVSAVLWTRTPFRPATPQEAARRYVAAWEDGAFGTMRKLVDHPQRDFVIRHREFSKTLRVSYVTFHSGSVVRQGDRASMDLTAVRSLAGVGDWRFHTTLRLARRAHGWRVLWSPALLYPGLTDSNTLMLTPVPFAGPAPVARDGRPLPADTSAQPYLASLTDRYGDDSDNSPGWAIDLVDARRPTRRLKVFGHGPKNVRTTLDRTIQAAADKAVPQDGALVAVRPSTGEVLAVADRLPDGQGAFTSLVPPGSTFKVITAAAAGADPGRRVSCPAVTVAGQRTIHNDNDFSLGSVPLTTAFAQSCNTTFATLGVSVGKAKLASAATAYGFGEHLDPGVSASSGDFKATTVNSLAEASIGQGQVQVSTLDMALVAAAVADGNWRQPWLVAARRRTEAHPVPGVTGLRTMMRAVVSEGTAAHAGLPAGTAGKTGTAEHDDSKTTHAWFIGYRSDLAFAVLMWDGGEGGKVAAPVAARFLSAVTS